MLLRRELTIELRLERVRANDLVVALPVVDLCLRHGVRHNQVERSFVL
jgi:hypothetical protein